MAKILLIEDDPLVRPVIATALEAQGHEVCTACDGESGLDVLRQEEFDLLVTDIVMPRSGGLRAIEAALELKPELKVLAISGGGARLESLDYLVLAESLGAHRTLSKPFRREELSDAVLAALSS